MRFLRLLPFLVMVILAWWWWYQATSMQSDWLESNRHAGEAAAYSAKATAQQAECVSQAALLRDLFGNPCRPTSSLAPAVLAWNAGTVPKIALAIYDDRAFDRLPVLADALEDAGCSDATILGHCRGGGEHVRGCWVVDLVLGKG